MFLTGNERGKRINNEFCCGTIMERSEEENENSTLHSVDIHLFLNFGLWLSLKWHEPKVMRLMWMEI